MTRSTKSETSEKMTKTKVESVELCTICDTPLNNGIDEISIVRVKGLKTLIENSKRKLDNKWKKWNNKQNMPFHLKCRKRYAVSKTASKRPLPPTEPLHLPPDDPNTKSNFNFEQLCFICARPFHFKNNPRRIVQREALRERLLTIAQTRQDELSKTIIERLRGIHSLVRVKARYHKKCYGGYFYTPSNNPSPIKRFQPVQRRAIHDLDSAIVAVCNLLEKNQDVEFLLTDLHKVMGDYIPANKTLFERLRDKYDNDISITQKVGKEPIISYRSTIEKTRILETAGRIIRNDIFTENADDVSSHFLLGESSVNIPKSLNTLLTCILTVDEMCVDNNFTVNRDRIANDIVSILGHQEKRDIDINSSLLISNETPNNSIQNNCNNKNGENSQSMIILPDESIADYKL